MKRIKVDEGCYEVYALGQNKERIRITIYNVCETVRNDGVPRNGLNPAHWGGNMELFLASPWLFTLKSASQRST
ncbi:hypothetical protein [Marinobacter salinus]|uniref:hypothetical protein n=1 Tax=Marinobacter salinus TaxID=1874317 RepID=UPI0012FD363D